MMTTTSRHLAGICATVLLAALAGRAGAIDGSVIDRSGHRHAVRDIEVRGSETIEVYIDGKRRRFDLDEIDRLEIGGSSQDQEAPVTLTLRTGRVERGILVIDGGSSPHSDVVAGGTSVSDRLTGKTDLGPLFLPLEDVRSVLLSHDPGSPVIDEVVNATIIDERGRRFEVEDLLYRNDHDFRYQQGRKRRRVAMRHLERIEFADAPGRELRPVTMTYRTGRVVQGEVDVSTVRLAGETDNVYEDRVFRAFTGRIPAGTFAIGIQDVKLILLRQAADDEEAEAGEEGGADDGVDGSADGGADGAAADEASPE